jgi:hypothetical protein
MYPNFHFGKFRDRNLHLSTLFFMPNFQPIATSQMTMLQGISYGTVKKGMPLGFVTFESIEQMQNAVQVIICFSSYWLFGYLHK